MRGPGLPAGAGVEKAGGLAGLLVCSARTGSFFHLNQHTCHPGLTISEDGFTVVRSERKTPAKESLPGNTRFTRYLGSRSLEHSADPL